MISHRLIVLFVILTSAISSWSADSTAQKRKHDFGILPSAFYTPETRLGLGVVFLTYFNPHDSTSYTGNAQFYLDATINKQVLFQSDYNVFTANRKYYFKGQHDISRFPEFFFGLGNMTEVKDRCVIDFNLAHLKTYFYRNIGGNKFLGLELQHQTLFNLSKTITTEDLTYTRNGYSVTGIGPTFLIDKRDYILNPQHGYYFEAGYLHFLDHVHMTHGFGVFNLDARHYRRLSKTTVLNTNFVYTGSYGVVPFRMLPFIGGPRFLRGYYYGRFRDKQMSLMRAELRQDLFWRIGIAGFGGVGKVFHDVESLANYRLNYNYGAGLRIRIHDKSQANIRIDYGRTRDSHGLYIVYGEAF
ncbi:hypothetical protein GYB22_04240 [bacterium]|nr:hypothetical protein [bacterium]